jgi:hypothetical protein
MHGGGKLHPMTSQRTIQTVILTILVVRSSLSQEVYLSHENAVSASIFVGRYNTDNKWGFKFSYSLKGLVQLSYTRSSVLTKERISNFQNEYFLRLYAPQEKRFFFSIGAGYLYQKVSTQLWRDYPVILTSDGLGFEGGVHFVTEDTTTRRVVVSVFYMYFKPNQELQTPEILAIDSKLARSLSVDVAVVYYLGRVGLVIGPRIALDADFKNLFFGLHSSFLIKH